VSRADLLALTPDALAALSNMGLVKRAQREIAEGLGPRLEEDASGTVTGTFPDGTVARLPRATTLSDAPCTCGAPRACRHRVAVALAYPDWRRGQETAPAPAAAPWSPGDVDDEMLASALGKRLLDGARATRDRGLVVTVDATGTPAARLPSCTVRFLVPGDVAYAKCDCVDAGGRCEHLALAVWAFRAAPTGGVVALGGGARGASARESALDLALALARDVLLEGVAAAPPLAARFARVRAAVEEARLTWLAAQVADLEIALEGHARRSARYGTREIAALLTELAARARAGRADGPELPARFVLGEDEASETLLDHVRLTSLGARVTHDGTTRFADVFLADSDTATVLVLRKRWEYEPPAEPEDGPRLAKRSVAARLPLGTLATGQLISRGVTRRANRGIALDVRTAGRTSVSPQRGDFTNLPSPLLVRDLAAHAAWCAGRPPRFLRPRVLAEEVHAIEVSRVAGVAYDEARQTLTALLFDAAERPFTLALEYRRSAPHAIPAAAAALADGVRYVAGDLVRTGGGWTLVPVSLSTASGFVVPDLAEAAGAGELAHAARRAHEDPVEAALARAESALEELCHAGLKAPPRAALERARGAAAALEDLGLARLARRVGTATTPDGWMDAAVRLVLVRDAG
jgi:hypothetical protein